MFYGYVRVSTKNQLECFGLEAQKNEILEKYPSTLIRAKNKKNLNYKNS